MRERRIYAPGLVTSAIGASVTGPGAILRYQYGMDEASTGLEHESVRHAWKRRAREAASAQVSLFIGAQVLKQVLDSLARRVSLASP